VPIEKWIETQILFEVRKNQAKREFSMTASVPKKLGFP